MKQLNTLKTKRRGIFLALLLLMAMPMVAQTASNTLPQFGITECLIQYKCSVNTPPPHAIRSG